MPGETIQEMLDRIAARRQGRSAAAAAPPPDDTTPPDIQATPEASDAPEVPLWRRILATGARVGGSWLGALGAGALATPETAGLGTIPAAMAGGAAGGALGETAAEWIEGRKHFNPAQIGVQGAIGAVPMGKILKGPLLSLVAKGALVGSASEGLSESAETGQLPSARSLERGAFVGGGGGAILRGIEHAVPALAKLRGFGGAVDPNATEALTVDRPLPSGAAAFEPVEGPSNLGVGRPATAPYRPTPRRSAADITAANSRSFGTPRPELPSPEGAVEVPGLPPKVRALLPSQRTPTRSPESLMEGPEGQIDIPGAPQRTPGRLPSDRLRQILEGPEDTGQAATASVGGHPTVAPMPSEQPNLEILDPTATSVNASGESAASAEALSRQRSMQGKGEQFVVYDKGGNRRPLLGPDAVDYVARQGETYGIEGPSGFRKLDDNGGRVPALAGILPERWAGPSAVDTPGPDTFDINPEPATAGAGTPKPRIPPKITALWQDLVPKWKEALAKQEGDQIPFQVDPHEDLLPFAKRVMSDDPRALMGSERKVRAAVDAGEEGSANPELLARLGLAGGGALAGSLIDKKNRGRGAVAGLALGAGVPALLRNPDIMEKLRYFSLLSSPATQAKNVLGNVGAVGSRAAELALTGNAGKAGRVLKEAFSPQTIESARESFTRPVTTEGRWGTTSGVLGIPGRVMGAMDEATQGALRRAGEDPETAKLIAYNAEPRSQFGQGVTSFHGRGGPLARAVVPFARTATNLLERGVERIPGVGYLPAVRKMQNATFGEATARQALGALAGLVGYNVGGEDPYAAAAAGPYALPFAVGAGIRKTVNRKGVQTPSDVIKGGVESVANAVPLPRDAYAYDPGKILAQYVPNALSLLSQRPPAGFDTSGSMLNPALAKIPGLNEALLRHKKIPKPRY